MRNNAYIVNPYPNEHSLRLRDPGDFAPGTFRRTEGSGKAKVQGVRIPKSVSVIWGKLKGKAGKDDPPVAQALRFPVKYWGRDPAKAKAWIKKHALKGRFEKAASKTKENMAAMETTFKLYSLINRAYKARQEIWMDRPHLAVPVVMLVEGVHNRILYPAEELATFPEAWNGIPVSLNHPKDPHGEPISCNDPQVHERQYLGRVWNVEYDQEAARLKGEVWFDIEHLREHAPELLNMVLNGKPVEVSTGLWGEEELVQGEWNGEEYFSILRAYRPDHLAVLPGAEGACNWGDGCGLRANKTGREKEGEMNGDLVVENIRSTARTPSYSGTESTSWAKVDKSFDAYRDGYYKHKGGKPSDADEIPKRVQDAPAAMKSWIASKSLLGDPKANTIGDLIFFPVVNPSTDKLNEGALRAVISGRGAQAKIPASALKSAQSKARSLLNKEFGASLKPQKRKASQVAIDVVKQLGRALGLRVAEEMSFEQVRQKLQDLLLAEIVGDKSDEGVYAWVLEVFEDYFVYEARNENGEVKLFKQKYTIENEDTGEISFTGDPVEVVRQVTYKEMSADDDGSGGGDAVPTEDGVGGEAGAREEGDGATATAKQNTSNSKKEVNSNMDRKEELIKELVSNEEDCTFCEPDVEWLKTLEEEQLEKLVALQKAKAAAEQAAAAAAGDEPGSGDDGGDINANVQTDTGEPQQQEGPEPKAQTPDEFIANAPAEIQEVLSAGLRMHRQKREQLVKAILTNKRNKFSKEKLEQMSIDDLEALAELAKVPVDFSANAGAPPAAEGGEEGTVPEPPRPKWTPDGKPDFSHLQ